MIEARAMIEANPINPERVFWELSPRLPDNCILSADSGTAANWYARDLKIRRGMMASGSGNLATMGPAVPYAVAAKFCFPDRVAIALTGDGAMQMNGLNACITVAKYWKEWSDPRWITLVLNNRDLNQVTWEQRIMTGDIKFDASQDLPDFPYAQLRRIDRPARDPRRQPRRHRRRMGRGAVAAIGPCVLEAITDPDVPTLPPHITLEAGEELHRDAAEGRPQRRRHHQAGGEGHRGGHCASTPIARAYNDSEALMLRATHLIAVVVGAMTAFAAAQDAQQARRRRQTPPLSHRRLFSSCCRFTSQRRNSGRISTSIQQRLMTELSQDTRLTVDVPANAPAAADAETALKTAHQNPGTAYLVFGNVRMDGGVLVIAGQLLDVSSGKTLTDLQALGSEQELAYLEAAAWPGGSR